MKQAFLNNAGDAFNPNGWSVATLGNGDFEIVYAPFPT